ncbi:MAG: FAD:protein FMN transferase [Burkholderiales bacterium]
MLSAAVQPFATARGGRIDAMNENDLGFQFTAMASGCEVRIAGLSRRRAGPLAAEAIAEVRRIEVKYSRYRADSIVSRINAAAGSGHPIRVDAETAGLLDFAAQLFDSSGGLFDITSGSLRKAWDFRAQRMPLPGEVEALLPLVGWHKLRWRNREIELPIAGMEIDFGGFGKEYAADRAATLLQERGVRHGLVNLGGDIRLVGPRLGAAPWMLAIQDPRAPERLLAELPVRAGALATSGDYERFFERDGVRYCHVLDPRTGWPVRAWRSVSVLAPACLAAGALTTVAMLKGADALDFLRSQNVAFLAVNADGRLYEGQPALN